MTSELPLADAGDFTGLGERYEGQGERKTRAYIYIYRCAQNSVRVFLLLLIKMREGEN